MTETFTGPRNTKIWENERGGIRYEHYRAGSSLIEIEVVQDLEQFFLQERDKELGRWRWPENPDFVAYNCDAERCVRVLDERDGYGLLYVEGQMSEYHGDRADAARAYFAAHPEPKPWHAAKPGEIWVITTENVADEVAVQVTPEGTFQYNDGFAWHILDMPILTARRIFPEVVSDA